MLFSQCCLNLMSLIPGDSWLRMWECNSTLDHNSLRKMISELKMSNQIHPSCNSILCKKKLTEGIYLMLRLGKSKKKTIYVVKTEVIF